MFKTWISIRDCGKIGGKQVTQAMKRGKARHRARDHKMSLSLVFMFSSFFFISFLSSLFFSYQIFGPLIFVQPLNFSTRNCIRWIKKLKDVNILYQYHFINYQYTDLNNLATCFRQDPYFCSLAIILSHVFIFPSVEKTRRDDCFYYLFAQLPGYQ